MADAKRAWKQMKADPQPLPRPVIVLGGIYDPGFVADHVADELKKIASQDARIIDISFFENGSFESCARKLITKIDKAFPNNDPCWTVEVDVVAFSMGGLVARHASRGDDDDDDDQSVLRRRRLRINRLFTIATPHQGARMANLPTFDRRVLDMRAGSKFLAGLQNTGEERSYEIIPYVRLDDWIVDSENAAPGRRNPWWLANPVSLAHVLAGYDVRILADIGRRLRGQAPFTVEPPAPIPPD